MPMSAAHAVCPLRRACRHHPPARLLPHRAGPAGGQRCAAGAGAPRPCASPRRRGTRRTGARSRPKSVACQLLAAALYMARLPAAHICLKSGLPRLSPLLAAARPGAGKRDGLCVRSRKASFDARVDMPNGCRLYKSFFEAAAAAGTAAAAAVTAQTAAMRSTLRTRGVYGCVLCHAAVSVQHVYEFPSDHVRFRACNK